MATFAERVKSLLCSCCSSIYLEELLVFCRFSLDVMDGDNSTHLPTVMVLRLVVQTESDRSSYMKNEKES